MPTRFKYTRSAPLDLGLTPVEILLATDAELNALTPVRHMAPYRRGGMGRTGQGLGRRVRDLKSQLSGRKWGVDEEEGNDAAESSQQHQRFVRQPGSGANTDEMGPKRKWGAAHGPGGDPTVKPAQGSNAKGPGTGHRGPKKRMGAKQRNKAKLALERAERAEVEAVTTAVSGRPDVAMVLEDSTFGGKPGDDDGEGKKRRKKKKKSAAE